MISKPYAPVSSLINHISFTPLSNELVILFNISFIGYDSKLPLACLILQYVHEPKHPVLIITISIYLLYLIFGISNDGNPFLSISSIL